MEEPAGEQRGASVPGEPELATELFGVLSQDAFDHDALALAERSAGIGVWSIDLTSGLLRATAQFFRIMGLEPTTEPIPMDVVRALRHPDDRERVLAGFREALAGRADSYEIEYRIIRPDGSLRWIFGRGRIVRDRHGHPIRYSGIDLDITDRKAAEAALAAAKEELERMNQVLEERVRERTAQLEAEARRRADAESKLYQAQKMEAVGQLTGGIAHDFNNILQVIIGNLEFVRLTLQRDSSGSTAGHEQRLAAIETARKASRSAAQLVQRLLAFSRQQTLEPAALSVNTLISEMTEMIRRTLGESIDVDTALAPDLWTTFVDRNQLEAALLNLVVNARDAMADGGRLTIETRNEKLDESAAGEIAPGHYVVLSVSDTGCGIAKENLGRVFEPFFTTKDSGRGSGLGLSMVYGFVRQSGGSVRIYSERGTGTTVRIYLPQTANEQATDRTASGLAADAASLLRARPEETVLLVEDNDDVRRLGASALEGLGYRVLQATDGPSALRMLDSSGLQRVDLLFTDIVLPGGMSGRALAEAARDRRPTLPVLFTSGYAPSAILGDAAPAAGLLSKPYSIEHLARTIRRAIDGELDSTRPD